MPVLQRRCALVASLVLALAGTAGAQQKAPSGPPVKFGVVTSLSGIGAAFGEDQLIGIKLAVAQVNARGGILGRPLVTVVKDDGADTATAAKAALQLIQEEKVDAIFASPFSSPASAVLPVTTDAKMISIAWSFLNDEADPNKAPYTFKVNFSAPMVGASYGDYFKKAKFKRVGILAADNLQGLGVADGVAASMKAAGIPVVAREIMEQGTADVTPQLDRLHRANPDVLVLGMAYGPDYVATLKGLKQIGWTDVTPIGTGAIDTEVVIKGAPPDMLARSFGSAGYRQLAIECDSPATKAFRKAVSDDAFNHGPITRLLSLVVVGYDGILMYANAANAAKSLNSDVIRHYLETHPYKGIAATYVYNALRHDGLHLTDMVFVKAAPPKDGMYELAPGQSCT